MTSATERPQVTVVVSSRARAALDERIRLLEATADIVEVVVASRPQSVLGRLGRSARPYLLDINSVTFPVATELLARRIPFVLDTGDDPATLARSSRGRLAARAYGAAEHLMVGGAQAVVHRGSFHRPLLRAKTRAPLWFAPDTVPDALVDGFDSSDARGDVIATFGSARAPRNGDRAYGWEVVDLVARLPKMTGVIVVRGSGMASLRARANRLGVADRVMIEEALPIEDLADRLRPVTFITSVQSDDLAGWVRTTGKLPIALGLGKALVTTRVGEASRVLPQDLLVAPGSDDQVVDGMARVIERGAPPGWSATAKELVQPFRRSGVAAGLAEFLNGL